VTSEEGVSWEDRTCALDVPLRYARGVDRRDFDLVRSCFVPGALVSGSNRELVIEEYSAYLSRSLTEYARTMHFIGNQYIERDGDALHVESYAVAYHFVAPKERSERDLVVGVRYQDRLTQHKAGWLIERRVVAPDWDRGPIPLTD
jgi:hypothetical protein